MLSAESQCVAGKRIRTTITLQALSSPLFLQSLAVPDVSAASKLLHSIFLASSPSSLAACEETKLELSEGDWEAIPI